MSAKNGFFISTGKSMQQDLKQAILTLLVVFFAFWVLCLVVIGLLVHSRNQSIASQAFPKSGKYYCAELGATLQIAKDGSIYLELKDGRAQKVSPSRSAHIYNVSLAQVFAFQATYKWNEKQDWITLVIKEYPEAFQQGKKYVFKSIE